MSQFFNIERPKILIIGGSAGSFPVVSKILEHMSPNFGVPVVMCLHRLKDKREGFKEALEIKSVLPVEEPNDKDKVLAGKIYIAPANYHLMVELNHFALATTEMVQYSRPSIDVLFESAADSYQQHVLAILLSGANRDGALGMKRVKDQKGYTIVQDPAECSMATMPQAALEATNIDLVLKLNQIVEFLKQIT